MVMPNPVHHHSSCERVLRIRQNVSKCATPASRVRRGRRDDSCRSRIKNLEKPRFDFLARMIIDAAAEEKGLGSIAAHVGNRTGQWQWRRKQIFKFVRLRLEF